MRRRDRKHCPHSAIQGIYGDAINHTPEFRRLVCADCGRYLDGPVRLATMRHGEAAALTPDGQEDDR